MRKLADNIWYTEPVAETDRPVLAIIQGASRALMVDGGNSPNHALEFLRKLRDHCLPEPDYVAVTHSHCDHIFGLSALSGIVVSNDLTAQRIQTLNTLRWDDSAVAERVAQGLEYEMTAIMLKSEMPGDRTDFKIREPEIIYTDRLEIDLGHLVCRLQKIGGDHAPDSSVILIPKRKIAFIGDCLYLRKNDPATVEAVYNSLLGLDAEVYVDSHEAEPMTKERLERRYFKNRSLKNDDGRY